MIDTKLNKHYDAGGISTLDVLRAKSPESYLVGYYLLTATNYLLRANHKGTFEEDVRKAKDYLALLVEHLDGDASAAKRVDVSHGALTSVNGLLSPVIHVRSTTSGVHAALCGLEVAQSVGNHRVVPYEQMRGRLDTVTCPVCHKIAHDRRINELAKENALGDTHGQA